MLIAPQRRAGIRKLFWLATALVLGLLVAEASAQQPASRLKRARSAEGASTQSQTRSQSHGSAPQRGESQPRVVGVEREISDRPADAVHPQIKTASDQRALLSELGASGTYAYSARGNHVVANHGEGPGLALWETGTKRKLHHLEKSERSYSLLSISDQVRWIAGVREDDPDKIDVWRADNGRHLRVISATGGPKAEIAFVGNELHVKSANGDGQKFSVSSGAATGSFRSSRGLAAMKAPTVDAEIEMAPEPTKAAAPRPTLSARPPIRSDMLGPMLPAPTRGMSAAPRETAPPGVDGFPGETAPAPPRIAASAKPPAPSSSAPNASAPGSAAPHFKLPGASSMALPPAPPRQQMQTMSRIPREAAPTAPPIAVPETMVEENAPGESASDASAFDERASEPAAPQGSGWPASDRSNTSHSYDAAIRSADPYDADAYPSLSPGSAAPSEPGSAAPDEPGSAAPDEPGSAAPEEPSGGSAPPTAMPEAATEEVFEYVAPTPRPASPPFPMRAEMEPAMASPAPQGASAKLAPPMAAPKNAVSSVSVNYVTNRNRLVPLDRAWRIYFVGFYSSLPAFIVYGLLLLTLLILPWFGKRSWTATAVLVGAATLGAMGLMEATVRSQLRNEMSGERFGSRPSDLSYGTCQISVPPAENRHPGELNRPLSVWIFEAPENPEKHFMLRQVEEHRDKEAFYQSLTSQWGMSEDRAALVFIHGYNVSFEDAVFRTAQLAVDMKFPGAPIAFCWPSYADPVKYTFDEQNAEVSIPALQEMLEDLVAKSGVKRLHVIAHSMGNRVLAGALRGMDPAAQERNKQVIRELVLAAPDIDSRVFQSQVLPAIVRNTQHCTLYASSRDRALLMSRVFHNYQRLGETKPELIVATDLDTIDASLVDTSLLGHSYIGDVQSIVSDLHDLVVSGLRPPQRNGLETNERNTLKYWSIKPEIEETAATPTELH